MDTEAMLGLKKGFHATMTGKENPKRLQVNAEVELDVSYCCYASLAVKHIADGGKQIPKRVEMSGSNSIYGTAILSKSSHNLLDIDKNCQINISQPHVSSYTFSSAASFSHSSSFSDKLGGCPPSPVNLARTAKKPCRDLTHYTWFIPTDCEHRRRGTFGA